MRTRSTPPPRPVPLYFTEQVRTLERAALDTTPEGTLMARAGKAAADLALRLLGSAAGARVLVLAGPGNNGGDALVAARHLTGMQAQVALLPYYVDTAPCPDDARRARNEYQAAHGGWVAPVPESCDGNWDLVIDGLFGIGLRRGFDTTTAAIVRAVNRLRCPVLALDVPSGLDADTGQPVDMDAGAVRATHTITFIADKPGLYTGLGRDHAGEVTLADLNLDRAIYPPSDLHLATIGAFQPALRQRRHGSHKGSHGDVVVAGGAHGMTGGAILAARAALFCGAGRVYAALLDRTTSYDAPHPELMLRSADGIEFARAVIVAGQGMGRDEAARRLLERALDAGRPTVLDADALNLVAADTDLQRKLASRGQDFILTPHPLEAARLLGQNAEQIQRARIDTARMLARRFNCIAVLKGSGTVIAAPDGQAMINPTGNAGLATAGSGDVLAGICGALLAQGFSPWHAALAGVWTHGAAADSLVEEGIGPIGLTASELIPRVRRLLNQLTGQYAES
ncbi:MAG TPA: NAD(P)H-hydrate dehydratase [Noviherbaspirillum sp.]|nr:NAD(P)H-hydrate dehydratase [Noviherbaspirillum sp.]